MYVVDYICAYIECNKPSFIQTFIYPLMFLFFLFTEIRLVLLWNLLSTLWSYGLCGHLE